MASNNPDTYYDRSEVSNSDLTELQQYLYPTAQYGDKEEAFKFGTLIDAMITEAARVDYFKRTVDNVRYTQDDFYLAEAMKKSLRLEARKDQFLKYVLDKAETQKFSIHNNQEFMYGNFAYTLNTRCKWDFWLPELNFGGDLKTTFAESQKQFDEAMDFFDWDRSRAWYMDVVGSNKDFIYAISKKNLKIFKHFITDRDHHTYTRGKDKYSDLAFKYWQLII